MFRLAFPKKVLVAAVAAACCACGVLPFSLYAAPLEGGFALAPRASASPEEKEAAFREARFKVLAAAGSYEKTPYRYGGVDRRGLDCSGLVYVSFREALGVSVPRTAGSLYSWAEKIQIDTAQPGDLLFFKTTNTGKISHVGIYAGGRRFIHAASDGPATGVIYSSMDERYWAKAYMGAGRVLPSADVNASQAQDDAKGKKRPAKKDAASASAANAAANAPQNNINLSLAIAAAPTWSGFFPADNIVRGVAGQLRLGASACVFGHPLQLGMELRPEWDGALGVFRLPLTLSAGKSDALRFFAGPALSFGDASLSTTGGDRRYTGGTSWIGTAGVTFAPFTLKTAWGSLAPYGELAWQSYISDSKRIDLAADLAAGLRLSTGLRYTWDMKGSNPY